MNVRIATLISVYQGDSPDAFNAALSSIFGQVFSDTVESRVYLAVDGPVSEEMESVISSQSDKIFYIKRLERNVGLSVALNAIIGQLGDEEFVFRMDADDRSHLGRYQEQLTYLEAHPEIDILGTDIVEVDVVSQERRRVSYCSGPDDAIARLYRGVPVAHPTVCFRRRVFKCLGGYPASRTNEDIAMWFACAKAGFRFDNVKKPLLEFTIGPRFWKRRGIRKATSELRCYLGGIWSLHGVSWRYCFPILRFMMRIGPSWLSRIAYRLPVRRLSRAV
jgi:glycosyltransferase involved in cell wall biosynthesis